MSGTTKRILGHIDYERIIKKRRENFEYLNEALGEKNFLALPSLDSFICPMVYPFVTRIDRNLRKEFIDHKIFVAKYWPNVHQLRDYYTEYDLANRVVPIPIDQRYDKGAMDLIINIIREK